MFNYLINTSESSWLLSDINLPSIYDEPVKCGDHHWVDPTDRSSAMTNNQQLYRETSLKCGMGPNTSKGHTTGDV